MKQVNNFVTSNQVGSSKQVTVEQGVNYLIKCPFDVKSNTILPTPNNPESVSWFIKNNGNIVSFEFIPKGLYNQQNPVCEITIVDQQTHNKFKGEITTYDSLGFMDDLLLNVKQETGLVLQYDCFGNPQ